MKGGVERERERKKSRREDSRNSRKGRGREGARSTVERFVGAGGRGKGRERTEG